MCVQFYTQDYRKLAIFPPLPSITDDLGSTEKYYHDRKITCNSTTWRHSNYTFLDVIFFQTLVLVFYLRKCQITTNLVSQNNTNYYLTVL